MDGSAGRSARGVVLAVVGASGGCGASTLAAACALHAAGSGWSVGVVDGAAGGAGIDVILGIEHVPGVRWPDLAGCRGRVDGLGLLSRMPRAGAVAVLAHCRDSPAQIGADAVRGVFAGLVEVLDLVVVDVPRSWALQDWALPDGSLREAAVREAALLDFAPREAALPSLRAVVVAGAGIVELAALAATAPRVAARVPETYLVLRGRRLSRSLLDDVGAALDLPVLGVLDDDPSVGRDLARGIPPGRSRGPLADLARAVVEALGGDRREAAS